MSVPYMLISVAYIAICTTLVIIILMQKKGSGLSSGMTGMGGGTQTYWDKNKGRSFEGSLEKYSKILGGVFMVLSLVVCLFR